MQVPIPSDVFDYFAGDPAGPMWNVGRALQTAPQNVVLGLNLLLDAMSDGQVIETQKDPLFQHLFDGDSGSEKAARIWIAERCLSREIARRKLALVSGEAGGARSAPYHLSALADLRMDDDHLVPLSAFRFDGSRLLRNGFAFSVLTTTSAPNSSYWLLGKLYSERLDARASVRLDPFLFGPEDQFPAMFYRMWMYGVPLNWERLANLQQPEHGRWLPASPRRENQFTDFCWSPRADGIHFVCEEVPRIEYCSFDSARYLHAIYNPRSEKIEHFDGALRVFELEEATRRHDLHVRNSGKLGRREKVFRTDEPIERDRFSVVAQAFYVWNEDVRRYFTQGCPAV